MSKFITQNELKLSTKKRSYVSSEIKVAEKLLKSKHKLSENVSLEELDKLWMHFPLPTNPNNQKYRAQQEKCHQQILNCKNANSKWLLRETPPITDYYKFVEKVLGIPGEFGHVQEVEHLRTKQKYAVKVVRKLKYNNNEKLTAAFFEDLRAETYLLACTCDHPNIVNYYKIFEDEINLYIIMDECSTELEEKIECEGKLNEKYAAQLVKQMLSAVYYLHELDIAHCDLKPENFLFIKSGGKDSDTKIVLIDFGFAKVIHCRIHHQAIRGTPFYIAPEVLEGTYDLDCDMWAIGVILYFMVFGIPPFIDSQSNGVQEIFRKIYHGFTPEIKSGTGPWFPENTTVSDQCRDMIENLLISDPKKRMTAKSALNHAWIKNANDLSEKKENQGFWSSLWTSSITIFGLQSSREPVVHIIKEDRSRSYGGNDDENDDRYSRFVKQPKENIRERSRKR